MPVVIDCTRGISRVNAIRKEWMIRNMTSRRSRILTKVRLFMFTETGNSRRLLLPMRSWDYPTWVNTKSHKVLAGPGLVLWGLWALRHWLTGRCLTGQDGRNPVGVDFDK
jgi:hypothetical protein